MRETIYRLMDQVSLELRLYVSDWFCEVRSGVRGQRSEDYDDNIGSLLRGKFYLLVPVDFYPIGNMPFKRTFCTHLHWAHYYPIALMRKINRLEYTYDLHGLVSRTRYHLIEHSITFAVSLLSTLSQWIHLPSQDDDHSTKAHLQNDSPQPKTHLPSIHPPHSRKYDQSYSTRFSSPRIPCTYYNDHMYPYSNLVDRAFEQQSSDTQCLLPENLNLPIERQDMNWI
jgi:hypothetical protein